ncbi:diguanylate cyclase domain-containing protein [Pseudomonas zhanjiangensis]|uniref:Diguanylate cyclase n=1 Tax=Pseudomonas zhanjiangensis TaxID=3239015 RepID=A0ABV3YUG5_9PSED
MENLPPIQATLDSLRRKVAKYGHLREKLAEVERLAGAMAATNSDLSRQLSEAQQRVRRWQEFFELSLDMLCIANTQGYFVDVNPAFLRVLGYSKEQLLQRPFIEWVHPDDVASTLEELRKLAGGIDTINFENRYRCSDGSYVWLAWCTPAPPPDSDLLYAIARDVSERKRSEAEILYQASHDSLTGLFNRAALMQHLQQACACFHRDPAQGFALLFLDLDYFKAINDGYGHRIGDELLIQVAGRLSQQCRDSDVVARLGGDEFVILASGQSALHAEELKARLVEALQAPFKVDRHELRVGASVGIARPGSGELDLTGLLDEADRQMYLHKLAGRRR